ncbi:NAD(P)/FAD-dependent oxidoreductase [Methylocapsa sp. S129]|uniref:NAD(P)/FAD-dependent oxidoreductase n=1 Tax=Methylocapsa sp. S129 TaxID=1641869 RepID=UPI00131E350C|nr:FAD-dependent oxidoreductase [Methylocapsa sp. S129]
MSVSSVVIIGAGHAGVQGAASLREEGFDGTIKLLSAEAHLPYQRPPLSKAFLKGAMEAEGLPLRAAQFYSDKGVDLMLGAEATRIDRSANRVELASGRPLDYAHLILATGARQRPLDVPGIDLDGVLVLRDLTDARALRKRLGAARRIVVVGAGFIGLEIAATAANLGREVTIVEVSPRPLARAVSPATSAFFLEAHQAFGAQLLLGVGVVALHGQRGAISAVELSDGALLPADLAIVGIGVLPEDRLARAAGLACDNGIIVNDRLETSDPLISAIGDCALFPSPFVGFPVRLESVQNAVDQARCVARRIVGKAEPYAALPWFWSDQGDLKLQIVGLSHGCDQWVMRGDPQARSFAMFGFRGGELAAVETVNRPGDHMAARRIIGAGLPLSAAQAGDPEFDLRKLAASAPR